MRKFGVVVLAISLLSLVGCGLTPPKPSESEYFMTLGGGFNFDRDAKTASYGITIISKSNVAVGNVIEARFENPTGGKYLVQTLTVEKGQSEFVFTSPPIEGLEAYTNYTTEFVLYESSSKVTVLGTHRQSLQSIINQADLDW